VRRTALLLAAMLGVGVGVGVGAAAGATDPSPPPVDPVPAQAPVAVVDRTPDLPGLDEDSGLAISPSHAGVLWTIEDSGNPPVIHALGPDGSSRAGVTVTGAVNRDWEAMAAWRDAAGRALLAVADIGDNAAQRAQIEIVVVAEPSPLRSATVRPLHRIVLAYPDGRAADAETLLVDPRTGRMFVVTKGLLSARVWAVPASVWPGSGRVPAEVRGTLAPIGAIGLQLATDGTVLPSGHVLVRSYGALALLAPFDGDPPTVRTLATVPLPAQPQGEGLAATATTVYLSSEGVGVPILRAPMPPSFAAAMRRESSSSPSGTVTRSTSSPAPPGPGSSAQTDRTSARSAGGFGVLALLGLVLAVLFLVLVVLRRRGHER
jgi:hypothetical protein